jgi:hypothetical protein
MKKALKIILGWLFIIGGVLLIFFLRELNDPEIEGEPGRISLVTYFYALIPIIIGITILLFQMTNRKSD